jgi:hypothetical protein
MANDKPFVVTCQTMYGIRVVHSLMLPRSLELNGVRVGGDISSIDFEILREIPSTRGRVKPYLISFKESRGVVTLGMIASALADTKKEIANMHVASTYCVPLSQLGFFFDYTIFWSQGSKEVVTARFCMSEGVPTVEFGFVNRRRCAFPPGTTFLTV